ncbi:hypothetical protein ACVWWG_002063 [Bradyrhizobium sp. LB7.2]
MQSMAGLAKRGGSVTGAMMIATVLLFPLPAGAQTQNGLSNLFGGIFSGPNPAPSRKQRPAPGALKRELNLGAARTAPPVIR